MQRISANRARIQTLGMGLTVRLQGSVQMCTHRETSVRADVCPASGYHALCTGGCSTLLLPACCLQPGLLGPMGALLPGQAVPTLSSLLTFLGYSGSCQQARPAENFGPCTTVASSPVGAFSQTAHCLPVTSALGQELCVVKTLESVLHGTVGTGHACRAGWASGSHCTLSSQLWHRRTGLSHTLSNVAPYSIFRLRASALAQACAEHLGLRCREHLEADVDIFRPTHEP